MKNLKNISAEEIIIGENVVIEETAIIRGINGPAKKVVIGDNTYIGNHVQIICDNFEIGDYGKIHHHTNIHGYKPCIIGHNAWIGQYSLIDSIGGTTIGDNCGIGAHSQLWSHIKYGDTLEGCRFLSEKPLVIGKDVWFVGHCIVSPITAEDKSMCLVGSVITKDLQYNRIYAGSPAKDITEKVGNQFEPVSVETKYQKMIEYLKQAETDKVVEPGKIKIVVSETEIDKSLKDVSYFNVDDRKYTKLKTKSEISFMKFLLPDKAKFTPY